MKHKLLFITLLVCGIGWGQGSENFENLPTTNNGTYLSRSWTGTNNVIWTALSARTDQTMTTKAICFKDDNTGKLTSPTYSNGIGTLSFDYVRGFTSATGSRTLQVWVNNVQIGNDISVSSSSDVVVSYSQIINVSGNVVLEIRSTGTKQVKIDNISWTAYSVPTSTTYTTSWSNSAPTASLDAIISGNLTTTTDLACKDLTINSGNTLTIGAGKKLTVAGNLINNGTIVFKSDASGTAMFDVFNGTQSGTGVVTAERYIPAKRAYRFVSSPVTTTTTIKQNWQENAVVTAGLGTHITGTGGATNGFDVTGTNNPSMYTFTNGAWAAVTNTNVNVLTAGTPYRLMVRGDRTTDLTTNTPTATATTLRSTGALQTGNLTVNLSSTANDVNFVANPYQAPIYAGVIFGSGSNYTNVNPLDFYIWDPALGSRGAYSTVSISNGQATGGSSHTNLIYPWEAFFVRTSINGAASITFKEAYKTEPNLGSAKTLAVDNRFLKLNLKGLQTNGTWNYVDGIRFDFATQFSNEVNTEDAQKLFNLDEKK
jgi:hypothetical protein